MSTRYCSSFRSIWFVITAHFWRILKLICFHNIHFTIVCCQPSEGTGNQLRSVDECSCSGSVKIESNHKSSLTYQTKSWICYWSEGGAFFILDAQYKPIFYFIGLGTDRTPLLWRARVQQSVRRRSSSAARPSLGRDRFAEETDEKPARNGWVPAGTVAAEERSRQSQAAG